MITLLIALRLRAVVPQQVAQVASGERAPARTGSPTEITKKVGKPDTSQFLSEDRPARRLNRPARDRAEQPVSGIPSISPKVPQTEGSAAAATPRVGLSGDDTIPAGTAPPNQHIETTLATPGVSPVVSAMPDLSHGPPVIGSTAAQVIASAGQPTSIRTLADRTIYIYPDRLITFVDSKVSEINPSVATDRRQGSPENASRGIAGRAFSPGLGAMSAAHAGAAKSTPSHLPNGRSSFSTASSGELSIALDIPGNLFFSNSKGASWEAVRPQWSGHAITVRLASRDVSEKTRASGKAATENIFELMNDAGAIWVSADGKTWTPRVAPPAN